MLAVGLGFDLAHFFAQRIAQRGDAIAEHTRAFELQSFRGGQHFGFEFVDEFFRDVLGFVGPADGFAGLA